MPYRTYRYVVREADTRVLELYMSFSALLWGLVFAFCSSVVEVAPSVVTVVQRHGGPLLWCGAGVLAGAMQFVGIHYCYPRWRRNASLLQSILWTLCALLLMGTDGWLAVGAQMGMNAAFSVFILFHRAAVA